MSKRLFVALPLPDHVKVVLDQAQRRLGRELKRGPVRWQELERSHLTLVFLGQVEERKLAACLFAVRTAAASCPPLPLRTGRFGAFPTAARPSVLWLGVEGDQHRLGDLQGDLRRRLDEHVQEELASRFRPHLTLARLKDAPPSLRRKVAELLAEDPPTTAEWRAHTVQLLESRLGPQGPSYRMLLEAPLGSSGDNPAGRSAG